MATRNERAYGECGAGGDGSATRPVVICRVVVACAVDPVGVVVAVPRVVPAPVLVVDSGRVLPAAAEVPPPLPPLPDESTMATTTPAIAAVATTPASTAFLTGPEATLARPWRHASKSS